MPRLPGLSGWEVVRVFEKFGWVIGRSGNHILMSRTGSVVSLSIPDHKEVAKGTLRALIRKAGLTADEFLAAMP